MAVLKVIRGNTTGQLLELHGERTVLGRHPNCQIVLDNASVSRHHAQILESHGNYFIEDLRSRNGTQINGDTISGRVELNDGDEVKLCDYTFEFLLRPTKLASPVRGSVGVTHVGNRRIRETVDVDEVLGGQFLRSPLVDVGSPSGSSILGTLEARSSTGIRLNAQPEVKLRAILEIGNAVGRMLKLDDLLPVMLNALLKVFPAADTAFVLLRDPATERLEIRSAVGRTDETKAPTISQTIVRQAMEGGTAILSADARQDQRFESSESVAALQIRSVMCAPLINQVGESLGVVQISTRNLDQQFTKDDLELLASVITQGALAIENATLHESLLKQREVERDLEFAMQVQLGFLPSKPPEVRGYQFADYYEAANRVGGDYFDYVRLPSGEIAIAIGDVAGKGVSAALLMARLHAAARFHLLSQGTVAGALSSLNYDMGTSGLGYRFVTLAMIVLDPIRHTIRLVNAGHLPPLLRHADGSVEYIGQAESGMPLGIATDQQFQEIEYPLRENDTLLLYTDGVTEAMNEKMQIFGRQRLMDFLRTAPTNAQNIVSSLVEEVESYCGSSTQRDDLCVVVFGRGPAEEQSLPGVKPKVSRITTH